MHTRAIILGALTIGFLGTGFGCSEDDGSTVSANPPGSAGVQSSSGGSGGSGTVSKAGSASSGSAGLPGVISTEACPGLPIEPVDPIDPSSAGSGGEAGGSAGGVDAGGQSSSSGAPSAGGSPEPMADEPDASAGAGGGGDEACTGVSLEAEAALVDLFIMMDRSTSLGQLVEGSDMTRWEALREAVQSFVEDPAVGDVRMGLGFFSLSGTADDALDCDADNYAEPSVAIAPLSESGPELVAAIDEITPAGLTPTAPALEGALSYARAWATDNPERATLVVLVTDGYPTQCGSAPEAVISLAEAGYESPQHIRTFVIGVGDVAKFNVNNYARAGGTGKAFLTDAKDVSSSFVTALGNISNRDLDCEYQLPTPPSGMKLDTTKVQVVYTPATGSPEEVPYVASLGGCATSANGGWYYDDANHPSKISVCPCTCTRFQAGRVDVRLGCRPRLGIR